MARSLPTRDTSGVAGAPKSPRYSWLGRRASPALRVACVIMLLLGAALIVVYLAYLRGSSDASPDGPLGVAFAVGGTALFVLVGAGYVVRKRVLRGRSGGLQTVLSWHIVLGVLALALILMHAAGNFHPRSGTFALYGLVAVVISGFVGRAIDCFCPRIAAMASLRAVRTEDTMRERLHRHKRSERAARLAADRSDARNPWAASFPPHQPAPQRAPAWDDAQWDLAYYDQPRGGHSLPTALRLDHASARAQSRPDIPVVTPMPSAEERARLSAEILRATERMRFAVALVRVWRHVHRLVCVVTVGLIIWHLLYAAMLVFGW